MQPSVTKDFAWFAKIIKNANSSGRGRELIYITPQTFEGIIKTILEQDKNRHCRTNTYRIANLLEFVYVGRDFCNLRWRLVSRQTVTLYLKLAVEELQLEVGDRKITFNSLKVSGRMLNIALKYDFDLYRELKYYGIPIV